MQDRSQTVQKVRPHDFEQRYGRRLAARAVLQAAGHTLDRPPDHSQIKPLAFELCFAGSEDRLAHQWSLFATEAGRERHSLDDPELEAKRCVIVTPIPHPLLAASMVAIGWWQQGPRTFAGPKLTAQGARAQRHKLGRALDLVPREVLYGPRSFGAGLKVAGRANEVNVLLKHRLGANRTVALHEQPEQGPLARCGLILVATKDGRPRLMLCTRPGGFLAEGGPLDRFGQKGIGKPAELYPDEALEACAAAREEGHEILDPDGILEPLEQRVRMGAVVRPVAGLPARACLVLGQADGPPARRLETSARHAVVEAGRRGDAGDRVLVSSEVADVAKMAEAGPVTHPVPIGPQAEAVGRYLATDYGLLIASGTGTGKSAILAVALEMKAERLAGLRALVVVKRALRGQFSEELRRFFPRARLLETEMAGIAHAIRRADHEGGERALVVVATYDQVRERARQFAAIDWDDLAVDEDGHLMSPSSQTAKALWMLRSRAQTASVLSATPLRRRLRDLECILAWVREDRQMLEKHSFSRQFPSQSTASVERLQEALGPVVVRFTRDDPVMRRLMPRLAAAEVVRIDPRHEEQQLIEAFNRGVVGLYNELVLRLEQVAGTREGDRRIAKAKEEAQELRRHITSRIVAGRGLFCDLETARHTDNRLVPLLNRDGLVDRALRRTPSKRQVVARAVADAVADELPVLVFADQAGWALHHLERELRDQHAVECGLLTGHTAERDRERLKRRFMAGELDVLLLGERYSQGQNLQRAKVVCHLNLPWVYPDFEQRNGRASRLGAARPGEEVQVWVPTLRGSLEEKVAQHLLPRAVLCHSVLDQGRVELRDSEVGRQVGALIEEFGQDDETSLAMRVAHAIWRRAAAR